MDTWECAAAEPEESLWGGLELYAPCMMLWSPWALFCCSYVMLVRAVLGRPGQVHLQYITWSFQRSSPHPRKKIHSICHYFLPSYLANIEGKRRRWATEYEMVGWHQWIWVWASSKRWWRAGKAGMLQSMQLQRVGHDLERLNNPVTVFWTAQLRKSIKTQFTFFFPVVSLKCTGKREVGILLALDEI